MKPWWKSRIIWLNAAAGGVSFIAAAWPDIGQLIPKWLSYSAGALVAAINVGLRFVTTDAVTLQHIDEQDHADNR